MLYMVVEHFREGDPRFVDFEVHVVVTSAEAAAAVSAL